MELKDLLPMYFDRSNAFETLWSFYLTVVLGLLAFSGGGKPTSKPVAAFLTVGFLVFAIATLRAFIIVTRQRCELQTLITTAAEAEQKALADTIVPTPLLLVVAFHLLADVLAIAGIWCFAGICGALKLIG